MNNSSLPLQPAFLRDKHGAVIPLRIHRGSQTFIFECSAPSKLLAHLFEGCETSTDDTHLIARGFLNQTEGLFIELFDLLGVTTHEPFHLDIERSQKKLLDNLLWQVAER